MPFILIEGGDLFAPEPAGGQSILIAETKIQKVGPVDLERLRGLEVPVERLDAAGCWVLPGLIDPHNHILGAGGENGFSSRMSEISLSDLIAGGITTVVGLLGTDTTTRHISSLYSKASQLAEEGVNAYFYTGGFELPPQTITNSVRNDLVLIDKAIGLGEVAISDERFVDPDPHELAFQVMEARLGGKMAGKAGVTCLHLGSGKKRVGLLHTLLGEYEVPVDALYPTHITRTPELMNDAVDLARRGAYVDMDTVDEDLPQQLRAYLDLGGPPDKLTVSSDSLTPGGSPTKYFRQFTACLKEGGFTLAQLLPHFTTNTAAALKMDDRKGRLKAGYDADVLVIRKNSYEIEHLVIGGRVLVRSGRPARKSKEEQQREESQ